MWSFPPSVLTDMAARSLAMLPLIVNILITAHASEFLKPTPEPTVLNERVSEQDIRTSLLDEVEGTLGTGSATSRLSQMESTLRPIVAALPKNAHGNLGHSAVRYALHRLFVLRHGWAIKGLRSEGETYNSSSPSGVLTDHVPAYIEHLFEQRLGGKGFGLHETAVLAATIEHLIHNEAVGRLGSAFNLLKLSVTSSLSHDEAAKVVDTYMTAFILGEDLGKMTEQEAASMRESMPEVFLAWSETQEFVRGVQKNVTQGRSDLDFGALAKVVEAVGEDYGSFQDFECRQMKDKLVSMEYRGTGRVKLSDFYRPALGGGDGAWQFQESVSYLRQLGALDETDHLQPSVMIANYVNSQTNCIAASGYYSVCCKDECENLLGHLEQNIGASEAKPTTIASLFSSLASSTVSAPHEISENLVKRLNDIAATHGGMVPLHGRLFAQLMHHVYPRECAYPHMSGTISGVTADQWMDESGAEPTASEHEMRQYALRAANATADSPDQGDLAVEELMPWSSEEELFVVRPLHQEQTMSIASAPASVRSVVCLSAAGSLAFALIRSLKMMSPLDEESAQKFVI